MVKFTQRDLATFAGIAGVADFLAEGRFSAPVARGLKKALRVYGPTAVRGAVTALPRLAGTAVGVGRFVTMKHPYIVGAVVVYEVVKHRREIAELAREGWEVIEDTASTGLGIMGTEASRLLTEGPRPSPGMRLPPFIPKRKASKFNSAIKAGMAAVKKSTSYGGKGKIKPAKRAFSVVVKLASAKKKKKKAPKGGLRRRIWNAMKGLR
jgi:hypothetical protein